MTMAEKIQRAGRDVNGDQYIIDSYWESDWLLRLVEMEEDLTISAS